MSRRRKVGILISGRGSNMQALIKAAEDPAYPAEIAVVISNRADANGLEFAKARLRNQKIPSMSSARLIHPFCFRVKLSVFVSA